MRPPRPLPFCLPNESFPIVVTSIKRPSSTSWQTKFGFMLRIWYTKTVRDRRWWPLWTSNAVPIECLMFLLKIMLIYDPVYDEPLLSDQPQLSISYVGNVSSLKECWDALRRTAKPSKAESNGCKVLCTLMTTCFSPLHSFQPAVSFIHKWNVSQFVLFKTIPTYHGLWSQGPASHRHVRSNISLCG